MEQERSDITLTKRFFIILIAGLLVIAGVVTIAFRRQPDYSFFDAGVVSTDSIAENDNLPGENVFPDAPVIPAPSNTARHSTLPQEEVLLPEIELTDPVDEKHSDVVHPRPVEEIFTTVDENAKPPEGMPAFKESIQKKLKYPVQASRLKVEGTVRVEFVIEKNGVIREVKTVKGIGAGCDEEAVRLVSSAPPWTPAMLNEQPVRQRRSISIDFKLTRKTRKNQ
jgi:periplasmic protein TonB